METKEQTASDLIIAMLKENTGRALCDSGGAYGRNWEQNQEKDFKSRPSATAEFRTWGGFKHSVDPALDEPCHKEISYTIDLYHYLVNRLDLDATCEEFNSNVSGDWGDEYYGVSDKDAEWINKRFDKDGGAVNTYNHESNLSQIIQYRGLQHKETGDYYVLLQIHGGCDARGGYTDAKLFRCDEEFGFEPSVMVWIEDSEGNEVFACDCRGYEMTDREGHYIDGKELDDLLPETHEGYTVGAEAMES